MTVAISYDSDNLPVATFSGRDLYWFAQVGVLRRVESINMGLAQTTGLAHGDWTQDIDGAFGEAAVAAYLNVFWSTGELKQPDVGKYQVRTASRSNDSLIIRPKDSDSDIFIFVTGITPQFTIRGWMFGKDGKRRSWIRDPNNRNSPAYFVPIYALNPPHTLLGESSASSEDN